MRLLKLVFGTLILITVIPSLTSCKKENKEILFEKNLEYCEFPIVEDIHTMLEKLDVEAMGISDILIKDSLLIVSTQNNKDGWYIYSLPDNRILKQFLTVGGGPLELNMPVMGYQTSFKVDKETGNTVLSIPQISGNKIIEIDLTSSIRSDSLIGKEIDMQIFSPTTYMVYSLCDNRMLTMEVDQKNASIKRHMFIGNNEVELPCIDILNQKKAEKIDKLISIMSFPLVNASNNMIVELGIYNSSIIVYDYKNGDAYNLTPCNTDNSVNVIEDRMANGAVQYQGGFPCNDFFMVIRPSYDADYKLKNSSLLFFDWNGKALGKLECGNIKVQRASVDIVNGVLYLFDSIEDQILKSDIRDFLDTIVSKSL